MSWNEEWVKGIEQAKPSWQQFHELRSVCSAEALRQLKGLLDTIPKAIKDVVLPGKVAFVEAVEAKKLELEHIFQDENDRQTRFMATVWADTTKDSEYAYFRLAMMDAYDAAKQVP